MRCRIDLLGGLRAEQCGRVVSHFRTQKTAVLLAYLAYYPRRRHSREELIELLWPECDPQAGRNSLNTALSWLRRQLQPSDAAGAEPVIAADRAFVGLNSGAVTTDVAEFEAALKSAVGAESGSERAKWLSRAVELYRGELLPGQFDDWILHERQWLAERYFQALQQLLAHLEREGDLPRALEYAYRGVSADPLREEVHGELMRLYAAAGQPSAALRQYRKLERLLMDQLGTTPDAATRALARDIERLTVVRRSGVQAFRRSGVQKGFPERLNTRTPEHRTPQGENRLVTVLFAALSRFEKRAAGRSPEEAAPSNRLLQSMVDALLKYEGRIDRFLGDGVLASFGAPMAHEDDAERAIRAAIEIQTAARQLGLEVRAGINTGEVYVGSQRYEKATVAGSVVSLAARLREQAEPGQILVGEATYRLSRRAFGFSRYELSLEGIAQPVAVYTVQRALPRPEKARGIEGLRAELVGRDEELAKLQYALAQVLLGQGQMVSLIGEAGVGKSRLVAELKLAVQDGEPSRDREGAVPPSPLPHGRGSVPPTADRPLWLEGRCLELGMTTSYSLFAELFRHYFAWPPEEDDERRVARIVASLEELAGRGDLTTERAGEIGPLLGNLLSLPFGNDWDLLLKNTSPEQVRHQTFLAVRDFFLAVAQQQPVVLVLEDLHWADSLSIDLIAFLIEALSAAPLLLLCIYRPEREHKCWRLGTIASQKCMEGYTELPLRELTPPQSRQLVASLLGLEQLPPSVAELILHKTRGNPFFVEEVVHAYIEAGIIYRDRNTWRAREDLECLTAPESVQSVILSRVDRLAPELKHVLQTASIVGRLFRRRLLEQALRPSGEPLPESLDTEHLNACLWDLEERGLIYQERVVPDEEYSFKHVLTQETIYQGLPRGRRAAFHRQVAQAIERLYHEGLDEYFEQLAHHHELSGTDGECQERALGYWIRAAERAHRAAAYHEEAALLTRAISIAERLERRELIPALRGRRGVAFHRVAMWPEARPDLEAGLTDQAPERSAERIQWLVELALVCHWLWDVPSMRHHAREALLLAEAAGRDDLAAGAMGALALADQSGGEIRAALSQFERAFARAGEIRIAPLAPAVHWSAMVLYWLGRYPEAVERAHLAIEVGRAVNDSTHTVLAMGDLGLTLMASGRYGEAMQTLEEALRFGHAHGIQRGIARSLGLRGGLHLELFDFGSAEALAEEASELARSLNWSHPVIFCGIDLLLNLARSHQVGRAEKLVDEMTEHVRAGAGCYGWGWALRFAQARAEIALARGDWNDAFRWAEDAIRRSQAVGRVKYQVDGLRARGTALAALGRKHEAIAALQEAIALARPVGDPALFLRAAAALLGIQGDDALAAEAGSAAQRMAAALPDGELRQRFETAEPVRPLRGWLGRSLAKR